MKKIGHNTKNKLLKVMIILAIILVLELIAYFIYKHYYDNTCYDILSNIYNGYVVEDDGYILVGNNDYIGTEDKKEYHNRALIQGEIKKVDKDLNILWTTSYYLEGDVDLIDIVKTKDGYIVIGNEREEKEHDDDYTGIILKVDKNGKVINTVKYDLLDNTKLHKIVRDGNNNIIIGESIYELDRIGNHLGGGIILKVNDNLEITEQNNYGGNKSGEFNNIFILDDSYLVYGMDAGYPIIVKFNKNFNREESDINLISEKIISYKTIDKDIEFHPLYYKNNKLYDGVNYMDLDNYKLEVLDKNKVLDNKLVISIQNDIIYAVSSNKLLQYNLDLELLKEENASIDYISKVIPSNKNVIVGFKCNKCDCTSIIQYVN